MKLVETIKKYISSGQLNRKEFLKAVIHYINGNKILNQSEIKFLKNTQKNRLAALLLILPCQTHETKKMFKVYLNLYPGKKEVFTKIIVNIIYNNEKNKNFYELIEFVEKFKKFYILQRYLKKIVKIFLIAFFFILIWYSSWALNLLSLFFFYLL